MTKGDNNRLLEGISKIINGREDIDLLLLLFNRQKVLKESKTST